MRKAAATKAAAAAAAAEPAATPASLGDTSSGSTGSTGVPPPQQSEPSVETQATPEEPPAEESQGESQAMAADTHGRGQVDCGGGNFINVHEGELGRKILHDIV